MATSTVPSGWADLQHNNVHEGFRAGRHPQHNPSIASTTHLISARSQAKTPSKQASNHLVTHTLLCLLAFFRFAFHNMCVRWHRPQLTAAPMPACSNTLEKLQNELTHSRGEILRGGSTVGSGQRGRRQQLPRRCRRPPPSSGPGAHMVLGRATGGFRHWHCCRR